MSGTGFTLPKDARLRVSADYRRVQSRGRKLRTPHLLVLYSPGRGNGSRFGLVVSRKVGNAVMRNRVKRWLREAIRHHRAELPGCWDLAIIASPRATTAGYATLERELVEVIGRIGERRR